ncbi:hypothetical protein NWE59_00640 [Mycoplasmopsis felis]|nr:hypothetical protein [Mycoplasmopsis felis]MCU9937929.1 hypothetical protein [Mycoplasmopsis felis]UWV78637.1 hypothetical protein NWE59_00640 [Mycoplasmopsis felis]UWW01297.1 hypothetical protein NW064_02840 [Mycoplasmopsis felis]
MVLVNILINNEGIATNEVIPDQIPVVNISTKINNKIIIHQNTIIKIHI